MQGDTLEYNVEHVQMPPHAVIEDLLRRLPGLHVSPDGTITYDGQKIEHLLVDGEDIFGSDPRMVTRNFDASKVAKIQVLDQRSDRALFTGMDDGARVKTINLVMKTEAKNGYFGKGEAGSSANGYYNTSAALAGFKDREQLTVLGLSGNTGVLGFSNNGGGGPASIGFLFSIPDPLGASAGMGIPHFNAIGLHYANRWDDPKKHMVANYQFGNLWSHPVTASSTFQTLTDTIYSQRQRSESINKQDQHSIRGQYDWMPSQQVAFLLGFHGNFYQYQNQYNAITTSKFNDSLTNNSLRTINDQTTRHNVGVDASWRIQPGRQLGRVLSILAGFSDVNYITNGRLYSINRFFQPTGVPIRLDTVDQHKQLGDHDFNFHGGMAYVQPIYAGINLGIGYDYSVINSAPLQHTFNKGEGKYNELIDSLSTDLTTQTTTQMGKVNVQGKFRHLNYTLGLDLTDYNYHQRKLGPNSTFGLHYFSWTPKFLVAYTPRPTMNIDFRYTSSVEQPSIGQLAPIKSNNDPLHVTLGNPDLSPVTDHQIDLGFRLLRSWMIGARFEYIFSANSISDKTITDSLGRQFSRPLNLGGKSSGDIDLSLNHTIGGVGWGLNLNELFSRAESYVNTTVNQADNYYSSVGITASKYVANKYNLQLSTRATYFYSRNSINVNSSPRYWIQTHSAAVTIYFLPNYEFGSNATYKWQQATSGLAGSNTLILWNAYASRSFLQSSLVVKAFINNILDQNSGIIRETTTNTTTETATNILGRFWMLSVIYHFDKQFKKK